MILHDLVRKINRGRCFVLVGSGPSCEMGYPSWHSLAESTFNWLKKNRKTCDERSYQAYLETKKYPELFRQAEIDIGNRQELINLLKSLLNPSMKQRGVVYEMLSKWPFACYLTTNYDDEIQEHLEKYAGEYFTVLQNQAEDFSYLRDGASHIIQKLHSDLEHPNEVIITSDDYQTLYIRDTHKYFPHKLQVLFETWDLFIIGHSLSDFEIQYILKLAYEKSSLLHPIYMTASNCTSAQIREYKEKYNIILLPYEDTDGSHAKLRRMLYTANRFISHRGQMTSQDFSPILSPEETQVATSLFLFRKTQPAWSEAYIAPVILVALSDTHKPGIPVNELLQKPSLKTILRKGTASLDWVRKGVDVLIKEHLVEEESEKFWITKSGMDKVQENRALRDVEKDQAYGQFLSHLRKECPSMKEEEQDLCQQLAEKVIINVFASRGLTIANKVFGGQSAGSEELSDIFKYISQTATSLTNFEIKAAFLETMHSFIVNPNSPQKKYLASVSQGFFLFHLLGLDPECTKLRRQIFENTVWICDASVLLPLVAIGCHNFDYATALFHMLTNARAVLYTTPKLLQEAWEHLKWAVNFVRNSGVESSEFLSAALVKDGYKQNLFLDGYIRLSAEGKIGSFSEYLQLVCPDKFDQNSFENNITNKGITVLNISTLNGYVQEKWYGDVEESKARIGQERRERGTWRSELQIESEAEVLVLIQKIRSRELALPDLLLTLEKCYFFSQGKILDNIEADILITWTPEAMYRYLSSFPDENLDPELFQQCMLNEYFNAGVSFIDKERYLRFFGPSIDASKTAYQEEKDKYIKYVEQIPSKTLDKAFNQTPDLEKPYFVARMGWRLAETARRSEEIALKRAAEAEARVKQLEAEKDNAWKKGKTDRSKQEEARLRNLQDPKHLRKRLKQAKKRRKKR